MQIKKIIVRVFAAAVVIIIAMTGCEITNNPPSISIIIPNDNPLTGSEQTFSAVVEDPDENAVITVTWSVTAGELASTRGLDVIWKAPDSIQTVIVRAVADDGITNGIDSTQRTISVINNAPRIVSYTANSNYVLQGGEIVLTAVVEEPDSEQVTFTFISQSGVGIFDVSDPTSNTAVWHAPSATEVLSSRSYGLIVVVTDEQNYRASDTLDILVYAEYGTVWIADSEAGIVSKYTQRGALILKSEHPFLRPVAITSDADEFFGCYVADYDAGEVVKLDPEGTRIDAFKNLDNVIDLAIHKATNTLWTLSEADSALIVFNTRDSAVEIARMKGFANPVQITINQNTADVWISDVGTDSVILLRADALSLPDSLTALTATIFQMEGGSNIFNRPMGIATLNDAGSTVYIADLNDGQVERLTYNNATSTFVRGTPMGPFSQPRQVFVNPDEEVWVINSDGGVEYFFENNLAITPVSVFDYPYFENPHAMAGDPVNGEVWIGDNGTHQVVKMVPPDSLAFTIDGFEFISDLVINK